MTTENNTVKNLVDEIKVQRFIDLFRRGVEAWISAGEILVELVEENPRSYDALIERCPQLNSQILARFEEMGRKTLHPQLLLSASPGLSKLKRLPYSLQERYLTEPISLVVEEKGETTTLLVKAKDMSKDQANQAFCASRVRTEGEQKAYILEKSKEGSRHVGKEINLWTQRGGKIFFNPDIGFTAGEIAAILSQVAK